jgi:hypothetical protein
VNSGEPSVDADGRLVEEHENTMKKEDEGGVGSS